MSSTETPAEPATVKPAESKPGVKKAEGKREKRTITEIRESKRTGEKMVYMSVPDYTSAQWAEMAGIDVAVLGDSLAMIASTGGTGSPHSGSSAQIPNEDLSSIRQPWRSTPQLLVKASRWLELLLHRST